MKFLLSRRQFLVASVPAAAGIAGAASHSLDRRSIVSRHNPVVHGVDPRSPLSVGNGEFAFTADVTCLQSLPQLYEGTVPLCTQSQWGWHSFPAPAGLKPSNLRLEMFDTYGRPVGYATSSKGQEDLFNWLRENPHRLNLGRLSLLLDSAPIAREDLTNIDQTLDLWSGILTSRFYLKGQPVKVVTCCHPAQDLLAVSIESPLCDSGRFWDFPMAAMTATRLGEPETAIECLFLSSPKNTWLPNGHNWQRADLPVYLPGNGGLLAAAAMMAASPNGFPKHGWKVRGEGLRALL